MYRYPAVHSKYTFSIAAALGRREGLQHWSRAPLSSGSLGTPDVVVTLVRQSWTVSQLKAIAKFRPCGSLRIGRQFLQCYATRQRLHN
mmetsp:Transcript_23618/g.58909  ORF Transcript_23618/g.58909 Transcript_23618/m.58909 type:complete len:88 (-) Transcript_23618:3229-3492(-)